jgi:hypothetical protein
MAAAAAAASEVTDCIFDLDGTLVESIIGLHVEPLCKSLQDIGYARSLTEFWIEDDSKFTVQFVMIRDNCRGILAEMSKKYRLHLYSMAARAYVTALLRIIDPGHELFQDRVRTQEDMIQFKDFPDCKYRYAKSTGCPDLNKTIVIDDNPNGWPKDIRIHPIKPFSFFKFSPEASLIKERSVYAESLKLPLFLTTAFKKAYLSPQDSILGSLLLLAIKRAFQDNPDTLNTVIANYLAAVEISSVDEMSIARFADDIRRDGLAAAPLASASSPQKISFVRDSLRSCLQCAWDTIDLAFPSLSITDDPQRSIITLRAGREDGNNVFPAYAWRLLLKEHLPCLRNLSFSSPKEDEFTAYVYLPGNFLAPILYRIQHFQFTSAALLFKIVRHLSPDYPCLPSNFADFAMFKEKITECKVVPYFPLRCHAPTTTWDSELQKIARTLLDSTDFIYKRRRSSSFSPS